MSVGVIGQQTLGLSRVEEFLIGREQNRNRKTLIEQRCLQEERAGQMNGIVAAQLPSAGQIDCLDNDRLAYVDQPILVATIALEIA